MPNGQQHGGSRGGRGEQGRIEERNQRSQRPPQPYRGEQQQDQRSAGGRSEAYAQQRDGEQMRAGYERADWERQPPTRTVRSEPHWDPTSARGTWDPAGSRAGIHGNWEDDRYYGSPSSGDEQRGRSYQDERSFGNRGREWLEESRYRSSGQPAGFGSRESYNRDLGGYGGGDYRSDRFDSDRNFGERGASGFGVYGSRQDIRSERDNYRGQGFGGSYGEQQEEGLGQQLQDAGRRLVGKVKRLVRNPKNYTRSDERIREDVCDRLAMSAEVDPSEVEVTVANGEVTLTGTVLNRHMKFQAEEIADDVAGVHEVHNQLRVKREQTTTSGAQTGTAASSDPQRNRTIGRS